MIEWLITGEVVLFVLLMALIRIVNRWIECQKSRQKDDELVATPDLISTWKKQITTHEPGSAAYESYKAHLLRAGLKQYGD